MDPYLNEVSNADAQSIVINALEYMPSSDTINEPTKSDIYLRDNTEIVRAQLDTGAFATCTDRKDYLHSYREFNREYPCPIRLLPATNGSDQIPEGVGYLRVPAHNDQGYLDVRTFYHPELRTTVIDERDFVKAAGRKLKDYYTGFNLIQRYGTDSFSIRFHHSKTISKDVIVHGILSYGKAYTLPLIKPTDAKFIINDMKESDPDFIDECKRAVITNIRVHRAMQRSILKKELQKIPSMYSDPDYHDTCINFESFIKENTPVRSIQEDTVRMLWHQRLGHPSDHYLYNAHKYIDGVPQFKHLNPVLDRCPVCLKAKQRKEPAGDNSTRTAEVPYQGLRL
jgi:hypothetical protein